tara:strand:- start:429 stop:1781 length:1353 start_codon:yes stop_codon:yes gene_type:complete
MSEKNFFASIKTRERNLSFKLEVLKCSTLPLEPPMFGILGGELKRATSAPWHNIFLGLAKTLIKGIIPAALKKIQFGSGWTETIEPLLNKFIYVTGSATKTQLPSWLKLKPYKIRAMYQAENWIAITKIIPSFCQCFYSWAGQFQPNTTAGANAGKYEKFTVLGDMLRVFHTYCRLVMSHAVTAHIIVQVRQQIKELLVLVAKVEELFKLRKIRSANANTYGRERPLKELSVTELKGRILRHKLGTEADFVRPGGLLCTTKLKERKLGSFYSTEQADATRVADDAAQDKVMQAKDLVAAQHLAEDEYHENNNAEAQPTYTVDEEVYYVDPMDPLNRKECVVMKAEKDVGFGRIEIDITGGLPYAIVHSNTLRKKTTYQDNVHGDGNNNVSANVVPVSLLFRYTSYFVGVWFFFRLYFCRLCRILFIYNIFLCFYIKITGRRHPQHFDSSR